MLTDIHADVFYPDVKAWQGLLMRVDRTLALQINDKLSEEGVGRCVLAHTLSSTSILAAAVLGRAPSSTWTLGVPALLMIVVQSACTHLQLM